LVRGARARLALNKIEADKMTAQDHNKTLVILLSALAAFFTVGLLASPWIIAQNFNRQDKILVAIIVFGVVLLMALLLWSTVVSMYRRKPVARKLALISAVLVLPLFWPVGVYAWWFMHSEGAKEMYGQKQQ
jgi:O-antigen/teichoic acid export membrane protein